MTARIAVLLSVAILFARCTISLTGASSSEWHVRYPEKRALTEQLREMQMRADAADAEVVRQAEELTQLQAELCAAEIELEQLKAADAVPQPTSVETNPVQLVNFGDRLRQGYLHVWSVGGWAYQYLNVASRADELTRQLSDAIIAWRPPTKMVQGREVIITAAIAYLPDRTLAIELATGSGTLRTTSRAITESMYVLLTSDESSAFQIEKLDDGQPDEQIVRPGASTYWQWRVTPLVEGSHTLRLQPYVVFLRDGNREKKQRLAVAPELITVSVSHPYKAERFWREYKPAVLSVFLFPFLTWGGVTAYRRLRLKLRRKPAEPPVVIWTP